MSMGCGLAYVVLDVGQEDVPDDGDHVDVEDSIGLRHQPVANVIKL
jgi:hypothetical protein